MDLKLLKTKFKEAVAKWANTQISKDEVFDDIIAPLFTNKAKKKPKWAVAITFTSPIVDDEMTTALYLSVVRAETEKKARDKAYFKCMRENESLRTMTLDHFEAIPTK